MFSAMMILSNLAGRAARAFSHALSVPPKIVPEPEPGPRFDFSDVREAYERHTTPAHDMRGTRSLFRNRR